MSLLLDQDPESSTAVGLGFIRFVMHSKDFLARNIGHGSLPHDLSSSVIISRVLDGFTANKKNSWLANVTKTEWI